MRKRALLAATLLTCAGPRPHPPKGEVILTVDGAVEDGPYRFGRDDLPQLPHRAMQARAPGASEDARYEGLPVVPFLSDHVSLESGTDLAVFHGGGGEVAVLSIPALRQTKPLLAYHKDPQSHETASFDLAFPNLDEPGIDTDPAVASSWLPGVDRIEMRRYSTSYGRALRVPLGAKDEARLGADRITNSCLRCHALRGVGGTRGGELHDLGIERDPALFSAHLKEHLRRLESDSPGARVGEGALREIVAFLEAVDRSGASAAGGGGEPPGSDLSPLLPPAGVGATP
jgi:hypothetical protein